MNAPLPPDRWRRVNEVFSDVADHPREARAARLDALCGDDHDLRREVESLLKADAPASDTDPLFHRAIAVAAVDAAGDSVLGVPARVGPYRILRPIGQGGMATVFLAARDGDEFKQRVAIKVVRGVLGGDVLRRFRTERQILASLEHPAIARLIDGGSTPDGVPYLVMEYVEGVPIDEFCRDRELAIRDRLLLFCQVCDAVSHAHRSLVVHRDLKPSNILVTADGSPKLLDFGIAKLLAADDAAAAPATITGLRALTPEYASPEQVRGESITTASDVYSLGVLLYELLTGRRPLAFDTRQLGEIERVVSTVEPRKPSTVAGPARQARQLAGDLDTIVLTALGKEPARRYPSASRLADDIRRHLEGLPVLARPATWRYRSSRFVRRHRTAVTAAALFAIVVAGLGVALVRQMQRVSQERDASQQVADLLLEMYTAYDPTSSRGSRVTARDLLDRGASRIQAELTGQPEVQARMLDAFGALYSNLGQSDRAVDVLRSSLALRESSGQGGTIAAAGTLTRLAAALFERERFAEAEPLARRAVEIRRRSDPRSAETAEALDVLGSIRHSRGGLDGAPLIAEAIELWRGTRGTDSFEFAAAVGSLARHWRERADYLASDRMARSDLLKAERFERELVVARRRVLGDAHLLTAAGINTVGELLRATGRPEEAEALFREALGWRRQLLGADARLPVVETIHNVALALHDQGRLAEAEPFYRESIAALRQALASGGIDRSDPAVTAHPQLAVHLNNLAVLLEDARRHDDAEAAFREAIAIRRTLLGADHPGVARTLNNLARLLEERGRAGEALAVADEALRIRRAALGDADFETLTSVIRRGSILAGLGRAREAAPALAESLAACRRLLPADNVHLASAAAAYGRVLLADRRPAEAEPVLREALAIRERALYRGHRLIAGTRTMLDAALAARPPAAR